VDWEGGCGEHETKRIARAYNGGLRRSLYSGVQGPRLPGHHVRG